MCTQELIWCSCGHGELLPINTCSRADLTGVCWTVVHGNHRLVVPMSCSYCKAGLHVRFPLAAAARPEGELATSIENAAMDQQVEDELRRVDATVELDELKGVDEPAELGDVVKTDWADFNLDPDFNSELWGYV